jgi:hypothetical protein
VRSSSARSRSKQGASASRKRGRGLAAGVAVLDAFDRAPVRSTARAVQRHGRLLARLHGAFVEGQQPAVDFLE